GTIDSSGLNELVPLKGDASCRHYFRLTTESTNFILVFSPPQLIDNQAFVHLASEWAMFGVNLPEVIAADIERGYFLLSDLGQCHLYDKALKNSAHQEYRQALDQLLLLQEIPTAQLSPFDESFLRREMLLFEHYLIEGELSLSPYSAMESVYQLLISNALEQPQVAMHRDYHSKNLMLDDNRVWIIDFQDAVVGPISYDIVSLLKDCYLDLGNEEQTLLIDYYLERTGRDINAEQFKRWYDLMGMQRHLKVLGLFIRLWREQGKDGYLRHMRRIFAYVVEVSGDYRELHGFSVWLKEVVAPVLTDKDWYR
ncbi:MAG: aminoglycoside phosphotransferase family protein, partial [Pseudomonadales bacterium]